MKKAKVVKSKKKRKEEIKFSEKLSAILVPEHSVIPDQQVLFIVIGCKGYVDGRKKRQSKGHRREYEEIRSECSTRV